MLSKISIIATTYNQAGDLDLYLKTLRAQSVQPAEVLVADDGSRVETRQIIEKHAQSFFGHRLKHIWHEDQGYRKCKILNEAIRKSTSEYLIFTDTDLILHPRFIEDHLSQMRGPSSLFMGRRVDLNEEVSDWIRVNPESLFKFKFYRKIVASAWFQKSPTKRVKRAFRISSPLLSKFLDCENVPDLLGSNFSIARELIFKINGFDEGREVYWGEDGDLFVRARNAGAQIRGRKSFAVQFHLWHPQRAPQPGAHEGYQKLVLDRNYVRCQNGLA